MPPLCTSNFQRRRERQLTGDLNCAIAATSSSSSTAMCHHGIVLTATATYTAFGFIDTAARAGCFKSMPGVLYACPARQTMTRMHLGSPIQSLQHSHSALIFIGSVSGSLTGDLLSSMLTPPKLVEAFSKPEARVAAQLSAAAAP